MVDMKKAEKEARKMGEKEASGAEFFPEDRGAEFGEIASLSQEGLAQSARFANHIAPRIRELAGCKDSMGFGTYKDCSMDDEYRVDELWEAFWNGYDDKLHEQWKAWKN